VSLVPGSSAAIEEQLSRLQELAQARVDTALTCGTPWLADAGLDALDKIRVLRATAKVNLALLPTGGQLREHLGADWVDLHGDIYDLVVNIGRNLEG
jgi:hypothetical protein